VDEQMFNLEISYRTRKGSNRELNQDSLIVSKIGNTYVMAVADGLGGHLAGEIASNLATHKLIESLMIDLSRTRLRSAMNSAINRANMAIYMGAKDSQTCHGMASTLVGAIISQNEAIIANVGDSRAYSIDQEIYRLTRDHSLVQQLVDNGLISEEESVNHDQKNIITRSLGRRIDVSPDIFDFILSEKVLLLCSDGVSNVLDENEIRTVITSSLNLEQACDSLMMLLDNKGADDDATLILARKT
jgi:PPM family protein phosphatase